MATTKKFEALVRGKNGQMMHIFIEAHTKFDTQKIAEAQYGREAVSTVRSA